MLLKISESITRLESLLLIAAPSDEDQSAVDIHGVKLLNRPEEERAEESRESACGVCGTQEDLWVW